MKKCITLLLFLFVNIFLFGQQNKLVPPEPNVATLGKYAIHPVNNYTGIPNINVPIYTIKSGTLEVPISLSYHSGGIRLNEESGHVGLGWALNAGGIITRAIEHKDDFGSFGWMGNNKPIPDHPVGNDGYYYPQNGSILFPNSDCEFMVNGVLTEVPNTILGTQDRNDLAPDTFHYNFNGMTGSFLLDQQGNPFMLKREPLKIELFKHPTNQGLNTFKVTTSNGDVYFFEKSQFTRFNDAADQYVSSWFLTKIKSATNDEIEFIYTSSDTRVNPLRVFHQSMTADNKYQNSAGLSPYTVPVLLSEIHFNNGKVVFNYSEKNEREDIKGDYFIKNINVFSKKGNTLNQVKEVDLSYSYFGKKFTIPSTNAFSVDQTGDYGKLVKNGFVDLNLRLKLDAITENKEKIHSFEYHNDQNPANHSIPNKTFMGQDYWGLYNGKTNRVSFIPSGASIDADRTPHPDHAKLFTLKKITYPTKGYTIFDHELHTFNGTSSVIGGGQPTSTTTVTRTASSNGNGESVVKFTNTGASSTQNVDIKIHHVVYGYPCVQPNSPGDFPRNMQSSEMYVELTKPNGDVVYSDFVNGLDVNDHFQDCTSIVVTKSISMGIFAGGEYTLKAYFDDRDGTLSGESSISVSYKTTTPPDDTIKYSKGGGLRIKSIANYDSDDNPLLKQEFNYHYKEDTGKKYSHGKLTSFPNYRVGRSARIIITAPGQVGFAPPVIAQSSSTNSLSQEQGSFVTYGQVEQFNTNSSGNTNGKTVTKYYNENSYYNPSIQITNTVKSNDWYLFPVIKIPINGLMYEQSDYKANNDNSFTKVRKVENKYKVNGYDADTFDFNDTFRNPNMLMGGIYEQEWLEIITGTGTSNYYDCKLQRFQFYPHYSNLIQQTVSKQTIFDSNGENPIVNEQKFYYDNDVHLQLTRTETTNSSGNIFETKIYYPDDITSSNSLSEGGILSITEYSEITKLKGNNLHRIALPIQTVTKRNNEIISVERNVFSTYDALVLPSQTKIAKALDKVKPRITYHSYNEKGQPLEISIENGRYTSYIWGHNKEYPVAKIENATYTQIAEALGITEAVLKGYNETNLSLLNGLRNNTAMPNVMVTTYVYDPLIGVTSITNPKGYTMYYEYDTLNRLKAIKDATGNLVSENVYHYKD
ncbi:RHS repeat protein [Aquimarina algiphila]|uniref:RHS repeat protein n=1 Tax=Aquimarina algiphila TaxID=2047982 RepID=A0A554VJQ2_9FLAO|nr:RHS repeat protein [Aquimarina algiphila]TSE08129.1 RHS repeat protein [Aquimarina algiphila]